MFTDIVAVLLVVLSFGLSLLLGMGAAVACWRRATDVAISIAMVGAVTAAMGILTTWGELPRATFADSDLLIPWKDIMRLSSMIGLHLLVANLLAMFAALMTQKSLLEIGEGSK